MAGDIERWTEPTAEQRYLYGRVPSFGLAHDAELMRQGVVPVIPRPERKRRRQKERGPFLTYLRLPWSYGDRGPGDAWHRMQCRLGHHVVIGGHTMQLGSTAVYVERRCRWCDAEIGAG